MAIVIELSSRLHGDQVGTGFEANQSRKLILEAKDPKYPSNQNHLIYYFSMLEVADGLIFAIYFIINPFSRSFVAKIMIASIMLV